MGTAKEEEDKKPETETKSEDKKKEAKTSSDAAERPSGEATTEEATTTKPDGEAVEGEEEEEEEKCGFCKFMKGGPCKTVFVAWEKCVDKAREKEEDFVDTCLDKTKALKECLEAHPDYYAPVLDPPEGEGEPSGEAGSGEGAGEKPAEAGDAVVVPDDKEKPK